jgi:ABC-type Fe3+/spermidine/putrescine transport system ATPase subunit
MMALRIGNVEKIYPDFRLKLDFRLRQGELLILLGPSGCGKTTTLRMIAGFIDPDSGFLTLDGRRIDTLPAHRRQIGIVFQDYALFPHLNVRDNVGFGLRMHGWRSADTGPRIRELLDLVSLEGYENRKVTLLSGGEQQRVALARALAPQPQLLLLDEPLSALDAKMRQGLRIEIRRIQRELGITTLYVTHDQEEALVLGDRVAVMREGHIEQIDTPENIYNRPRNLFVGTFLGQANLIRGRLAGREGELAVVETAIGVLKAVWPAEAKSEDVLGMGREVTVFFRPEHCALDNLPAGSAKGSNRVNDSAAAAPTNRIEGRVVRKEYLGSHHLIEVEAGGVRITLDLADRVTPVSGRTITFSVSPHHCCLFAQ